MKILITGAGGFIGSHLTEECVKQGFDVKAFVHYNSKGSWGWLEKTDIKDEIEVIAGDIRDYDSVFNALKGTQAVFHLAALIGIPYSYISPKAYIETNINGTYNILQASRELGLENVLVTSTSETYGTAQYVPIDEKHPIVGQSPYSATKIAADQLAVSFYRAFNTPVKIVRPFNTYGPRQSARAIIPTIITQALNGNNSIKIGNLKPTRDLTFVKDTCKGFLEIYKSENLYGEITNIGMGADVSIGELVNKIIHLLDKDVEVEIEDKRVRPAESEVERLICDNKKLVENTNWEPSYTLDMGLEETIVWLKQNISLYKTHIYNV